MTNFVLSETTVMPGHPRIVWTALPANPAARFNKILILPFLFELI